LTWDEFDASRHIPPTQWHYYAEDDAALSNRRRARAIAPPSVASQEETFSVVDFIRNFKRAANLSGRSGGGSAELAIGRD
jgi:hypothetical protein